jgi:hypothetical protein
MLLQSTGHELIPQGMGVLRQCKVPRAEVMFVTIQRENILPPKKWTRHKYARCFQLDYESLRLFITDQ